HATPQRAAGRIGHRPIVDPHVALGGPLEQGEQPEQGALARAIVPDDADRRTARDAEPVQLEDQAAIVAMPDPAQLKHAPGPATPAARRSPEAPGSTESGRARARTRNLPERCTG